MAAPKGPLTEEQARLFRDVMLPHMDGAYNLARFLTRDQAAAEDIVQTAFLKAYAGFSSWRGEHAKAWLFAIVRNCFLTWSETNRGWTAVLAPPDEGEEVADPEAVSAEGGLIRKQDVAYLRTALEDMAEPFREALVLRELEDMSYREIAEVTGVAIGTVMSRLSRARQLLMVRLIHNGEPRK